MVFTVKNSSNSGTTVKKKLADGKGVSWVGEEQGKNPIKKQSD